jgi:predicted lipid-binding transport protein (Tim44 family)
MKHRALLIVLCATALGAATAADAARFGGGRSIGMQRSPVTAPRVAPAPATPAPGATAPSSSFNGPAANPVMPRSSTAAAPAASAARTAAPATGGARWLGPLAGIAAGLGLAALLSHAGISPAMSDILLIGLFALGAIMLARMFIARRVAAGLGATPAAGGTSPLGTAFEPRFGGAAPVRPARERWPPGFDATRFAREALQQFRAVQRAYDNGDTARLSDVMTPELYTETVQDLRSRGVHVPTAFDALEADVVDVSTEADLYWVSVRFHGLAREDGAAVAQPFDEVWNLSKPVDGSTGWLVAGIQQSVPA